MSKSILEKTSFGIIRTNPKLTSNVKLVADSSDRLYLESFSVNDELSKSKYKKFKVSSRSDYYFDLYRFYNQKTKFTKETAFQIFEKDDGLSLKEKYGLQYDTTYGYGTEATNSKLYSEEFSMFAPLWIEPSNIPDYFIICRIEDPVSVNTKNASTENDISLIQDVKDPRNFIKNILDKGTIISSFNLTNQSNLGRYIRKHAANPAFPEASINANWEKDRYFEYNGINLAKPGFVSKKRDLYYESWPNDKTIIEFENNITDGFSSEGIVHPNILNLQFLFDDNVEDYRFQRYFGLYVNKAQYNEFFLDGNSLFTNRFVDSDQLPLPLENNIGYQDNIEDQIQTNENGIVIYAEDPPISCINPNNDILPNEIVYNVPRIGYVQDAIGNFHKIKNDSQYANGTIRINDSEVNWKDFTGFQDPENYVDAEFNFDIKGRPACVIEFENVPINDDEFRINFIDQSWSPLVPVNPLYPATASIPGIPCPPQDLPYIDNFTMIANNAVPVRQSDSNLYSTKGSLEDIAAAFVDCVNGTNAYFPDLLSIRAIAIGTKVIIFSRVASET